MKNLNARTEETSNRQENPMKNSETTMKKVAAVLLERAQKIEGVSEHSLEVLRRLLARDGDPGTLFVEFRDGERGSAPGVEIRVGVDALAFHDAAEERPIVEVNWSSAGTQTVAVARKFVALLSDVVDLASAVESEIDELEIPTKCPRCGGEVDLDPSDDSVRYCTECGVEVVHRG